MGTSLIIIIPIFIVVVIVMVMLQMERRRCDDIREKYPDNQIADMIIKHMFWQGQTAEQLLDSLGRPADVDQKVLKTKTKEIWKYHQTSRTRFGLRITLENNVVVGWDKKD